MSIRIAPSPPSSLALMREARAVFACSLGLAVAATFLLVLGGAVRTTPAMAGLVLFAGILIGLDRRLAAHHPHPRLGAANRITLGRAGIAGLIAGRAIGPGPLAAAARGGDRRSHRRPGPGPRAARRSGALGARRGSRRRPPARRRRWLGGAPSGIG